MIVYSVKDIAQLLSVNDETVRRWIREGRLEAERSMGKGGSSVTDEQLKRFLEKNKKFFTATAASSLGLTLGAASGVVAAGVLGALGPVGMALGALSGASLSRIMGKAKDNQDMTEEKDTVDLTEILFALKLEIAQKESELNLLKAQLKIIEETKGGD